MSARDVGRPRGRVMVDLFSGTGGASAAARRRGWRVVAVELEARFRPDVVADVRALPLRPLLRPDLLWSSPPCTEFSTADARVDHATKRPAVDLVAATLAAVAELRPRWWVLENVRGAIPFLGIPAQKIGPWCLWGYFPLIRATLPAVLHRKGDHATAAARAAIPDNIAEGLLDAVEQHDGVSSLLDLRPFRRHRHRAARRSPAQLAPELDL